MRARDPESRTAPRERRSAEAKAPAHPLLALQRTAGNRATAGMVQLARQVAPSTEPPMPITGDGPDPVELRLRERGASPGASGAHVMRLQVLINDWRGADVLHCDGVYGPMTEAQVAAFQQSTKKWDPAPSPNPLPPPPPPPPGPWPEPDPFPVEPTGEADPATVMSLEIAARKATGQDLDDLAVAKEGLILIRDHRDRLSLSLLSAIRNVYRLIAEDDFHEFFRGSELSYWEAIAEHTNGHMDKARALYQRVLDADEGGWEGLHDNCYFQFEYLENWMRPQEEPNPDPNLEEGGGGGDE